ncbi:MAG: hypothetical protein ABI893_00635 [Polaromonas sp.]
MTATLTAAHMKPWPSQAVPERGLSRTERIRRLLKQATRPVTAMEICFDMAEHFLNFETSLVWLLLKYDIKKGRVIFEGGKYRWNDAYDTAEAAAIRAAIKLLASHGYEVALP